MIVWAGMHYVYEKKVSAREGSLKVEGDHGPFIHNV